TLTEGTSRDSSCSSANSRDFCRRSRQADVRLGVSFDRLQSMPLLLITEVPPVPRRGSRRRVRLLGGPPSVGRVCQNETDGFPVPEGTVGNHAPSVKNLQDRSLASKRCNVKKLLGRTRELM